MPKQSQKGAVDEATIMLPALLELEQSLRVAVVMGGGVKRQEAGIGNRESGTTFDCLLGNWTTDGRAQFGFLSVGEPAGH